MPSVPDSIRETVKRAELDSPMMWENPVNQTASGLLLFTPASPYLLAAEALHRVFVDYPRRRRRGQADAAAATFAAGAGQLAASAIPGGKPASKFLGYLSKAKPAASLSAWLGLPFLSGAVSSKYDADLRGELREADVPAEARRIARRSVMPYVVGAGGAGVAAAALFDYIRRRIDRKRAEDELRSASGGQEK